MLDAGAVDVLQADVTRCGGDHRLPAGRRAVPARAAAALGALRAGDPPARRGCALEQLAHLEYFHDHVRIEQLLFDGVIAPRDGALEPDLGRAGMGLELKRADAEAL